MIACTVLGGAAGCYDYIDVSLCPPVEHDEGEETILHVPRSTAASRRTPTRGRRFPRTQRKTPPRTLRRTEDSQTNERGTVHIHL